jgi:phospholipid transport system substrate-binding protein
MVLNIRRWSGWLVASTLIASSALGAPVLSATDAIRKANEQLRGLLAENPKDTAGHDRINKQISEKLKGLLDIPFLAQRALVNHWKTMSATQRSEVQSALQAIVEKNYLNQLHGKTDYRTEYLSEEKDGDDIVVKTAIHTEKDGRPTKILIDYRLRLEGDHWRAYDVVTEDVSILDNYRSQFNRIIAKEGVDGLIKKMKNKLEAAKSESETTKDSKAVRDGGSN